MTLQLFPPLAAFVVILGQQTSGFSERHIAPLSLQQREFQRSLQLRYLAADNRRINPQNISGPPNAPLDPHFVQIAHGSFMQHPVSLLC